MKISEFKKYVDEAYKKGKDADVEFWIILDDGTEFIAELESLGQFNFIPDMTVTVKPANNEQKIYTTKIVDEKQFDYREAYTKLVKEINKLYKFKENIVV